MPEIYLWTLSNYTRISGFIALTVTLIFKISILTLLPSGASVFHKHILTFLSFRVQILELLIWIMSEILTACNMARAGVYHLNTLFTITRYSPLWCKACSSSFVISMSIMIVKIANMYLRHRSLNAYRSCPNVFQFSYVFYIKVYS